MTGFAAKLTDQQHRSLTHTDGVLFVAPDEMLSLHTTHSTHFLGLEIGIGLWNESSLASDVVIGGLDTGIWPEHVSFNDKGVSKVPLKWKGACEKGTNFSTSNCNKRLIGARAFLKGYEAINGRINETDDFRSARDSNGHGTHTGSTAAGNVVPAASLFGNALGIASGMRNLSRNHISGVIPAEFGNLRSIGDIDLSRNQLTGTVPQELGQLQNLFYFFMPLCALDVDGRCFTWGRNEKGQLRHGDTLQRDRPTVVSELSNCQRR